MSIRPTWVWSADAPAARNAFAVFRRTVQLDAVPEAVDLRLCADTRYRLRVNGAVIAHGPSRGVPQHLEWDRIDLAPWLVTGANVIAVEVHNPNASTFQTMPDSKAGFIADGFLTVAGEEISLATPGAWRATTATAWSPVAPAFSFAQGPIELCDLAALPDAWFTDPAADATWKPVAPADGPWNPPVERSTLRPDERPRDFVDVLLAAPLDDTEIRVSAAVLSPPHRSGKERCRFPYELRIHSPTAQTVTLGLFWGPHYINGTELAMTTVTDRGNRQECHASLKQGWNVLSGSPEALTDVWGIQIGVPRAAGLKLDGFRVGAPVPGSQVGQGDPQWRDVPLADAWELPARACAWDRPATALAAAALPLTAKADRALVVVLDAGGEFLGRLQLDVEAPAGTWIDVVVDERRRADGLLALYATNPFTDSADRLRHVGGRATIHGFHPRGGRFVQVVLRPPAGATGTLALHTAAIRPATTPIARDGSFACADPVFDWTWKTGTATLQACAEDAFLDCPWRERGTYLGDALVEAAVLRAVSSDRSLTLRTLSLFAQAQRDDGLMPGCAPSWLRQPMEDFSYLWVQMLHDHWAAEGDRATVRELWPHAQRILASPGWKVGADGLPDSDGHHLFVDWGVSKAGRGTRGNAVLALLRLRALTASLDLAPAAQHPALRREAEELNTAIRSTLWRDGRYAASAEAPASDDALHANVLALLTPAAAGREESILAHVEAGLAGNLARAQSHAGGHLELYFLHYAIDALYRHGRIATAESVMRSHWGLMRDHGAWTFWETINHGRQGNGSLCHAWSATPLHWFHTRVLGVRPEKPGDTSRMLVAPESLLPWAEGVVPHPAGPIHVAWERQGNRWKVDARGPRGVQLRILTRPVGVDSSPLARKRFHASLA